MLPRTGWVIGTGETDGRGGSRISTRHLVPDSLHVHPVPDYGAIQLGAHRFCHDENGKEDCGIFQFIHVWQKLGGRWRTTRVLSYGALSRTLIQSAVEPGQFTGAGHLCSGALRWVS
jgi:hypothetical protein